MKHVWSNELKEQLYEYRQRGYSAGETAQRCNDDYRREFGKDLTRNSVCGQWYRMGLSHTTPNNLPELVLAPQFPSTPHKSNASQVSEARDRNNIQTKSDKYHRRKCLQCGKDKVMLRINRRCDNCKHVDNHELVSYEVVF